MINSTYMVLYDQTHYELKRTLNLATNGITKSVVNGLLWWFYVTGASFGKSPTSRGVYQMFREADEALAECNYDHFRQAIQYLQRQKLIAKRRIRTEAELAITEFGKQRLNEFLPVYHDNRPWDGFVYLISYDIPEKEKQKRDLLREYLKRISCAKLQASVWITPYTPRDLVDVFTHDHAIEGTVLVSKLDKHGFVGDETLSEMMVRLYCLKELNEQYEAYISIVRKKTKTQFQLAVQYQTILGKDPQLPFEILPDWWAGDQAHQEYQKIVENR